MKNNSLIIAALMLIVYVQSATSADATNSTTVTPSVTGFALDKEFDGVFETLRNEDWMTIGRVVSGASYNISDRRGIIEFNIKSIPSRACIQNATLSMYWHSGSSYGSKTNIYGYTGNGILDTSDIYQTTNIIGTGINFLYPLNKIPVTAFIQSLVNDSKSYAGFVGVETLTNANRNYSDEDISLRIEYTFVPEPATLLLVAIGGLMLSRKCSSSLRT